MFWLAGQGLYVPIAISALITLFVVAIYKTLIRAKWDNAMENIMKNFVNKILDILYTMSANLAGGTLLAKVLQPLESGVNSNERNVLTILFMF